MQIVNHHLVEPGQQQHRQEVMGNDYRTGKRAKLERRPIALGDVAAAQRIELVIGARPNDVADVAYIGLSTDPPGIGLGHIVAHVPILVFAHMPDNRPHHDQRPQNEPANGRRLVEDSACPRLRFHIYKSGKGKVIPG